MNPYESLPAKAFWRPAIADRSMFQIDEVWDPKFVIRPRDPVVTFGSCFAQHIGKALKSRGFNWLITEPPPKGMNPESEREFNYNVFSCRTGNIYTTSLLRQWVSWALEEAPVPDEYWSVSGRYFDPFRPAVEPNGFESLEELEQSRRSTIAAFARCIREARYFVFTLGLTESWINAAGQYEYPMCPGTVAGEFDPDRHKFRNQSFPDIRRGLLESIAMMRKVNPTLRFILTVSPVPLTATYSRKHVLVATTYSKSILRGVAGMTADGKRHVDYFPSYELITAPPFRGTFFEPNQRNVTPSGVNFVMDQFFNSLGQKFGKVVKPSPPATASAVAEQKARTDEVCEEELLEAFGARS